MSYRVDFRELLLDEFACYYNIDEPLDATNPAILDAHLEDMARDSARRLSAGMSDEDRLRFTDWLSALRNDRSNPIFDEIDNQTQILWRDDEEWNAFRRISARIVEFMRAHFDEE